jgi:hypothetical protein
MRGTGVLHADFGRGAPDMLVAVSWPGQQEIAAVFAVLAVLAVVFALVPRPFCWPVLLVVVGLAVVPLIRGEDFPLGALWLVAAGLLLGLAYVGVDLGRAPSHVPRDAILTLVCVACTTWLWVLFGAPVRLLTMLGLFLAVCFAVVAWTLSGHRAAGLRSGDPDSESPETLVDRDKTFLDGLYKAAEGEIGRRIPVQKLIDYIRLPTDQVAMAAERLLNRKQIDEIDGSYALRHEGAAALERGTGVLVKSEWTFNAPVSGVVGPDNTVTGSTFTQNNAPPELIAEVLKQAGAVRAQLPAERQAELAEAEADVQAGTNDPGRLRRGAERIASIAKSIGEIGAPLLKAATDLIHAFGS